MPNGTDNKKAIIVIAILAILFVALIVWAFAFFRNVELPSLELPSFGRDPVEDTGYTREELSASAGLGGVLWSTDRWIEAAYVRDDRVYVATVGFGFGEPDQIVIERLSLDGTVSPMFSVPREREGSFRTIGFSVADTGHFRFLIQHEPWGEDADIYTFYVKYDETGQRVFYRELTEFGNLAMWDEDDDRPTIWNALFADTGEVVIHVNVWGDNERTVLAILDQGGEMRGVLDTEMGDIARLRDGRIVFSGWFDDAYFYEIDVSAGDWGEALTDPSEWGDIHRITPSHAPFDLYFSTVYAGDWILFGYDMARGEAAPLLNWNALWESMGHGISRRDTLFLSDGRIVLHNWSSEGNRNREELVFFTPYEFE